MTRTTDRDEALLRCQEHNLRLERERRLNLVGTPPDELPHLQIVALAGEFYAEMIATHREEPGRAIHWQQSLGGRSDDFDLDIVYGQPRGEGVEVIPLGEETVTPLCIPQIAKIGEALAYYALQQI